jgi:toxin ParE1/3/4
VKFWLTLSRLPEMGREGRWPGTRALILPDLPFRIVYRVREDTVQVLRVDHTKRKWPSEHQGSLAVNGK